VSNYINKCVSTTQTGGHTGGGVQLKLCAIHRHTYITVKALVGLMLTSNGHVTLRVRLTVFEIFAFKWPKFRPKISHWGIPGATVPKRTPPLKGEKTCLGR